MHSEVGPLANGMQEGNSILYALIKWMVKGAWLPNSQNDVFLHPTAHGAWVGLLVTMINLLPIGQLDGGHVATAYFGNRYNRFAERLRRLLPIGAFWCSSGCCMPRSARRGAPGACNRACSSG